MKAGKDNILREAVETIHIVDSAITNAKLAANAVKSANINKAFETETTVTVGAGSTSTITAGIYLVSLGANTSVEYTPDGGTTWRTLLATGTGGVVISDGSSVRLNNAGAAAEDSYLLPLA
jgi:hypothetical protein